MSLPDWIGLIIIVQLTMMNIILIRIAAALEGK